MNHCGTLWFLLWDEFVETISTSLIIPQLPSKIQFPASGTELNTQLVPLISSRRLALVHQLHKSTQLFFREITGTTCSSLGFSLLRLKSAP
jgi:hypothetical protein